MLQSKPATGSPCAPGEMHFTVQRKREGGRKERKAGPSTETHGEDGGGLDHTGNVQDRGGPSGNFSNHIELLLSKSLVQISSKLTH